MKATLKFREYLVIASSTACFTLLGCLGDLGPGADADQTEAEATITGAGVTTGAGAGTSSGPGTGSGGFGPGPSGPSLVDCTHHGSGKDYQVGPGKEYETVGAVPFETLVAGDTVRIFWREAHYHEKMMIGGQGTADQPIRVCGVTGPNGELPVIDGENATTRSELQFPFEGHQVRGLVIVGHKHDDPYALGPTHIVIESLEIRNASPPLSFTDKTGAYAAYSSPAAGIFVQRGEDITIRACTVTQNNNGLFVGSSGGPDLTRNVLIESNYVYENGGLNDPSEHNAYNETSNITYQFNHFGPPRKGPNGQVNGSNIKDRSAGTVIRYNWIEDGAHMLDLVDAQEASATTVPMPSFHQTYVYGNVLVRGKSPAGSMVHYGGDSYVFQNYRKGTLFFYNNTVIVKNEEYPDWNKPAVFELSTMEEHLDARNNIFFSTVSPVPIRPIILLGQRDQAVLGTASFTKNWATSGWTTFDPSPGTNLSVSATEQGFSASVFGTSPGFQDSAADDYRLLGDSPARGAGLLLTAEDVPEPYFVKFQYVLHQTGKPRDDGAVPSLGALP